MAGAGQYGISSRRRVTYSGLHEASESRAGRHIPSTRRGWRGLDGPAPIRPDLVSRGLSVSRAWCTCTDGFGSRTSRGNGVQVKPWEGWSMGGVATVAPRRSSGSTAVLGAAACSRRASLRRFMKRARCGWLGAAWDAPTAPRASGWDRAGHAWYASPLPWVPALMGLARLPVRTRLGHASTHGHVARAGCRDEQEAGYPVCMQQARSVRAWWIQGCKAPPSHLILVPSLSLGQGPLVQDAVRDLTALVRPTDPARPTPYPSRTQGGLWEAGTRAGGKCGVPGVAWGRRGIWGGCAVGRSPPPPLPSSIRCWTSRRASRRSRPCCSS